MYLFSKFVVDVRAHMFLESVIFLFHFGDPNEPILVELVEAYLFVEQTSSQILIH